MVSEVLGRGPEVEFHCHPNQKEFSRTWPMKNLEVQIVLHAQEHVLCISHLNLLSSGLYLFMVWSTSSFVLCVVKVYLI